jgi:hypothetical protein
MINTLITKNDIWKFESPVNFNTINVDGLYGTDGIIYLNGINLFTILSTISGNAQSSIDVLSSNLIDLYTIYAGTSGNFQNTYTIVSLNSSNWDNVYTIVQNNSTSWEESTDISNLSSNLYALSSFTLSELISTTNNINYLSSVIDLKSDITLVNSISTTLYDNITTYNTNLSTDIRNLSGEYLTISDAIIEYQPIGAYLSSTSVLNNLNDVSIINPTLDQIFRYNGTKWINGNATTVNGGAGVDYFYVDTPSDISPYSILSKTPTIGTEIDEIVTCTNNRVYLDGYISPLSGIGGDKIDSGIWTFDIWGYSDVNDNTSQLLFDLYTRNITGGETFLFEVSSGYLTDILEIYSIVLIQPEFPIDSTDRLLIKIYGETSSLSARNIHFVHGGNQHYSHFNTPLIVRHNDLAGLNGGGFNEYNHLNSNDYNNVLNLSLTSQKINDIEVISNNVYSTVNSNSSTWQSAIHNYDNVIFNTLSSYSVSANNFILNSVYPTTIYQNDSSKHIFGTGNDFEIYYTGTNQVFDPVQSTSQIVFNESGLDTDFRIEGNAEANLFYLDAGAKGVWIRGTANPTNYLYSLAVNQFGGTGNLILPRYSNDTSGALLTLAKSRGTTENSYTYLNNGDLIGRIAFSNSAGTAFSSQGNSARIEGSATENHGATARGTKLDFYVIPNTTTTPINALAITDSGNLGIGNSAPNKKLTVTGDISATQTLTCSSISLTNATTYVGSVTAAGIYLTLNINGSALKLPLYL